MVSQGNKKNYREGETRIMVRIWKPRMRKKKSQNIKYWRFFFLAEKEKADRVLTDYDLSNLLSKIFIYIYIYTYI